MPIKRRLNYYRKRLTRRPVFHSQAVVLLWAVLMGVVGALATLIFFQGVHLLQLLMNQQVGTQLVPVVNQLHSQTLIPFRGVILRMSKAVLLSDTIIFNRVAKNG